MVIVINIFFVDPDPDVAARQLCDKHVVKMIVESGQLLSTAHRFLDGEMAIEVRESPIYKETGRMIWVEEAQMEVAELKIIGHKKRKVKVWGLPDERQGILYAASHMQHPSGIWCRETVDNYYWLYDHMCSMMEEYTYRYNKRHSAEKLILPLSKPPHNLTKTGMTPAPSCMPAECKIGDVFTNYREYYNRYKRHIFNWKGRPVPDWIRL